MEPKTKVIFRYWNLSKVVTAIFPELKDYVCDAYCDSYERIGHIGYYGACNPKSVFEKSREASPEEYAALKSELESIGYNLEVIDGTTNKVN